jgi:TP901-1 family phage major tail protein
MKYDGNDIIVFFQTEDGWRTLAYGTTCEVDINAELIEIASPNTGLWKESIKGQRTWSGSSAHLMSDVKGEVEAYEMLDREEPVMIYIGTVQPHYEAQLPEDYVQDKKWSMSGKAHVKRVTVTANCGSKVTLSLEFEGTGEPTWHYADWLLASGTYDMEGVWINREKWVNE